jgi:uncharacterized protein
VLSFYWIVFILFVILLVAQWTVFFGVRNYILARPSFKIRPRHIAFFVLSVAANLLMAIMSINANWSGPDSILRQSLSVSYFFYLGLCLSLFLFFMALAGFYSIFQVVTVGHRAAKSMIEGKARELQSEAKSGYSVTQASNLPDQSVKQAQNRLSRRNFMRYTASTGALAIVSSGSYGLMEAYETPKVNILKFSDPSLDALSRSVNIIQITDLHYGMFYSGSALSDLIKRLNSIEADAVVVTGDIFHSPMTPVEPVGPMLRNLRKRSWGNFAVLGNHDFYAGVHRSVKTIQEGGLRLLRNEWMTFDEGDTKIHLGGIDDPRVNWLTGKEIPYFHEFTRKKPRAPGFYILLSHRPVVFPLAVKARINLTLAGHTHGGQFTIPAPGSVRPWSLAGLVSPYTLGLYESGQSRMYLNCGVGLTFVPARINCPPEIAVIHLEPSGKSAVNTIS